MLWEVNREKENKTTSQWKFYSPFFPFWNQSCYVHGQNLLFLSKLLSRFLSDVLSVPPHLNSNTTNILMNFCLQSVIAIMFICFGRVKWNNAAAWEVDVA